MAKVNDSLVELSLDDCRHLLRTHRPRLGRLAFVDEGWPLVFPMNFFADDKAIYFRTGAGSKLLAALRGGSVSFELDYIDEVWEEGWSVLALGRLRMISEPEEIARAERFPLRPWAGGDRPHYLRMDISSMTGRRIV